MNEIPQNENIEDLEENPDAIMFSELFVSDDEYRMNWIDFHVFKATLEAWIEEEEKIDPDIARYMGMALLGVAEKIENIGEV